MKTVEVRIGGLMRLSGDVAARWDQYTDEQKKSLLQGFLKNVVNLEIIDIEHWEFKR